MKADYFFVYGTLLKDSENEMSKFLVLNSQKFGGGYFKGKLYKVSWYPGAVISKNKGYKVFGTFFKLNVFDSIFKILDAYEGISGNDSESSLFKRECITAFLDDGIALRTWIYLYNQCLDGLPHIEFGDFLKFLNK